MLVPDAHDRGVHDGAVGVVYPDHDRHDVPIVDLLLCHAQYRSLLRHGDDVRRDPGNDLPSVHVHRYRDHVVHARFQGYHDFVRGQYLGDLVMTADLAPVV